MIDAKNPKIYKTYMDSNKLNNIKKPLSKTTKKTLDNSPKFHNLIVKKLHTNTNMETNKKSYYLPLTGGRNYKNKTELTGSSYKSSLKNLQKSEFSENPGNHQKNITGINQKNKKIINYNLYTKNNNNKYNNIKDTQNQKLNPEKELLKKKLKFNNILNERNSTLSQNITIGSNNINKEKSKLNFSDEEENEENSLHSFIVPSPENTEDTNEKKQTTQINIDNNIFGIYLTIPELKKNSKETFKTEGDDAEISEKEIKEKSKLNKMEVNYNKINKKDLRNLNDKKIKNNPITNIKTEIEKKNIDNKINFSVKNVTTEVNHLKNFNTTLRTNKFFLSNKKYNNSIRSFSSCNSKHNLPKKNSNSNYYYFLKSITRPPNMDMNKNNSVGHFRRNDTKEKNNNRKENKQKIRIKIKKNNARKENTSVNKNNKPEKNLDISNNSNKLLKLLSNLDNKKILSGTIMNINPISNNNNKNDNNKNEINNIENNKSTTLNNTLLVKKLYKNLKNNSKQKFDTTSCNSTKTILPKKNPKSNLIKNTTTNTKNLNITNSNTEINQKEIIPEKDLEKPSLPLSSNRHSLNFIPREYPNMAPKLKIDKEDLVFLKEKKTINSINFLCKRGYSGPGIKKLNQDNYFIYKNFLENENYIYMGICDGHGIFGQNISDYLVENLPKKLNNFLKQNNMFSLNTENIYSLSKIFEKVFLETNNEMNNNERIDSSLSGSTCVSLIFTNERIICINVGDSRCILGKYNNAQFSTINLSRDHKPDDDDEKERIIKKGGIVEAFKDNDGNFIGPKRVWCKENDVPGLAMSRSFGDEIAHSVGVICNPEIFDYRLLKEDKFIILASDGIWEFINSEEVVDIVKEFYLKNDSKGATECLYEEACKRWMNKEGIIDDITIIVVFFE